MGVLILVRHGQASFLADDYDKLSPLGEDQARRLGAYLTRHKVIFHRVCTGLLERQRRTAQLVGEVYADAGLPWPEPELVDGLVEFQAEPLAIHLLPQLMKAEERVHSWMHSFEQSNDVAEKARFFQKAFEVLMVKWVRGDYGAHEIEPWEAFSERVNKALQSMMNGQPSGQRIVAFTSGGVTAVAVQRALQTTPEATMQLAWMLRNAALTEFLFTKGRFTLSSFNDVPHLPDPQLWTFR